MNLVQPIKGFSRYEIDMTDFFDVKVFSVNYRRTGRRQQLVPCNSNNHLMFCLINDEDKQLTMRLHQLVWREFNGEIPKGYDIHHINFNPSDNRPENLVLLSHSEHRKLHKEYRHIPVVALDKQGNFVAEYSSIKEASKLTCISKGNICQCCKHKSYNSAGGFIWIYKDEYLHTQTQQDK